MSQDKYIAAIEIGSSKIVGAVGCLSGSTGRLNILAVEQEHVNECVKHGIIINLEETANRVNRILDRLESRAGVAPRKIRRVFMNLAGRSLRNVPREVSRNLAADTEITRDILDQLHHEALDVNIDSSLEVLEAIPAAYIVNKTATAFPVGTTGNHIRVKYQLIAARPQLRNLMMRMMNDKVGIEVAGTIVTPLAVGSLILSEDERRQGCMLVDMGSETTTVTVYQEGALHYLAVLPIGSRLITRDITSLSLLEKEAEEVKITSGNAIAPENVSSLNINGIRHSDMIDRVVARSEELVANIIEQMKYAGVTAKELPGGIVTVGGGFLLNGMNELLRRQSDINVRRGALPSFVTLEDTKAPTYETIEVISILNAGLKLDADECLEIEQKVEMPADDYDEPEETPERIQPRKQRQPRRANPWMDKIRTGLAGIFKTSEDDDADI